MEVPHKIKNRTTTNEKNKEAEDQPGNRTLQHYKPTRPNRKHYVTAECIFLSSACGDKPYARP